MALPQALESGGRAMQRYGGAKLGDRTMLDALLPALDRLSVREGIRAAADAAEKGARDTAEMGRASAGRAAYVPSSHLVGNTDPGAEAIAAAFAAAAAALS
jgi:triose/dihydroxyacetone kinase / FAD-AMP lyase (cyclizing)